MFSKFFIYRPIFSIVLFIVLTMAGLGLMYSMPVAQFPNIAPPTVLVSGTYAGAIADATEKTVTVPLETKINGVEGMIYMSSVSTNNGVSETTVTFDVGSNTDMATVNTLTRANLAVLPPEVLKNGLSVKKTSPNILQVISFESPDERFNEIYLSNYVLINVVENLKRVPGVGDVNIIGSKDYSMRIWLNPYQMTKLGITAADVTNALLEQNADYPTGRIGMPPSPESLDMTYNITSKGRLKTPEEFEKVILKTSPDHAGTIQIKDIGRVTLGAENYEFIGRLDGKKAVMISIYAQPGANELSVAQEVRKEIAKLSQTFPNGIQYKIPHDTTVFVDVSIHEVLKTIFEATILVFCVVYIFLQNWRATIIPIIAIPICLIGTFIGMSYLGYSINTLTLFGMVLAIGLVVDDAIVVVENVERLMHEEKLSPKEATLKAMKEVTSPVIAIVCVLCSVFIPVTFLGGLTGKLYEQFAITIAVSMVLSGFTALTLSPALSALLLKPPSKPTNLFFQKFNDFFEKATNFYGRAVTFTIKRSLIAFLVFAILILWVGVLFKEVPMGLVPEEDQGYLIALVKMPDAASLNRTSRVAKKLEKITREIPEVKHTVSLVGFDFLTGKLKPNSASCFIRLKDWKERGSAASHSKSILTKIISQVSKIQQGQVLVFNPPPIPGLGKTAGAEFYIQNRGGADLAVFQKTIQEFLNKVKQLPEVAQASTTLKNNVPQYFADINIEKIKKMGVSLEDFFMTVNAFLGSYYVNDFNWLGRTFKVKIQADETFRLSPRNLEELYVRSQKNQKSMIPISTLCSFKQVTGPEMIDHYNGYIAAYMNAAPKPSASFGQLAKALETLAEKTLPPEMTLAWTGAVYQAKKSGSKSAMAFIFGFIMVVLILAAQYEKILLPFSILLSIPFGVFGALIAVFLRGLQNDIYFQIGLLTLIGLCAKNAILIVEFAIIAREQKGLSIVEAAVHAAKIRFRPILMTSLAFIFGVLPLCLSHGAGAASRHSIGTGILGGMMAATFLAIFFIPLFYERFQNFSEFLKKLFSKKSTHQDMMQ
jgi:hydrophobe/amphiphile efflux-1 (HAE1) family protein